MGLPTGLLESPHKMAAGFLSENTMLIPLYGASHNSYNKRPQGTEVIITYIPQLRKPELREKKQLDQVRSRARADLRSNLGLSDSKSSALSTLPIALSTH